MSKSLEIIKAVASQSSLYRTLIMAVASYFAYDISKETVDVAAQQLCELVSGTFALLATVQGARSAKTASDAAVEPKKEAAIFRPRKTDEKDVA